MMLLVFGIAYHLIRTIFKRPIPPVPRTGRRSLWMALALALVVGITYLIRIIAPVGDWLDLPLLGFQPAHVTQYILCFGLGIAAYRWNILEKITDADWKRSLLAGQMLIVVVFPSIFLLSGKGDQPELFMGGGSPYSFVFALWEQLVAVSMIIAMLGLFRKYFNNQNSLLKDLSRSSYAIYIFHGVVLVGVFLLSQSYSINSLQKFIILLLPNLAFCYLLAKLILKIPVVQKVL